MDEFDDDQTSNGANVFLVDTWSDNNESPIKSLWEWHNPQHTPLKISISGAAGTGKKQLAESLSRKLEIPLITSIPRTVKSLGGTLNKNATMADEFMMFLAYAYEQNDYPEFVSATTMIDLVAHMHYVSERTGERVDSRILDAAANLIHMIALHSYSVVFYLPFRHQPKADGVRSVDIRYLTEIDRLIRYYLDAFDLDYFPLDGPSASKFSTAMSYMSDFHLLDNRDI